MSVEVVVDASVWVSLLIPRDVNHNASATWMTHFINSDGLLVAPTFLLLEIAASIARQQGTSEEAKETVADLSKSNEIRLMPLDSSLLDTAIDIATNLQLRAGDSIYVAVAHQLNIPLVSWDKEQLRKASSVVQTYSPEGYPF